MAERHTDLAGLKRNEISVELTDNAVVIEGERKRELEDDREGVYSKARRLNIDERPRNP
jgi:HSP20 family molecular chaperone IbpA